MKKRIEDIKSLFSIIAFCMKISFKTSKLYFILNIVICAFKAAIPFALIYMNSRTIAYIMECIIGDKTRNEMIKGYAFLVVIALFLNVSDNALQSVSMYIRRMYTEHINSQIKVDIMRKSAFLEMKYFDSPDFFDTLNDVNYNSHMISEMAFVIFEFFRIIVQLTVAFVNIVVWKWFAPIIIIITYVPAMIVKRKEINSEYLFQKDNMKYDRQLYYVTDIAVDRDFSSDVKMYGLFPELKRKYSKVWREMFYKKRKMIRKYTVLAVLFDCLPYIVMSGFLVILGISVLDGKMTVQSYSYINGLLYQFGPLILAVIIYYGTIFDSKIRLKNFMSFMNMTTEEENDTGEEFTGSRFELEFRNVYFRYNEKSDYVLNDLSFKINSDKTYALVGVNGCGKTSIIKLMLRFYEPTSGEILINGKNIKDYSISSIRKLFSPMFQKYNNYAFTVKEDIYLSDIENKTDDKKAVSSAVQSGADEFVSEFDEKYDTYLTRQFEDGVDLSGGQWQKIALSRTIFRNSVMYILDEPSSALDAESEDELFMSFDKLFERSGAIMVSHRLSNVKNCDSIIVIDDGRVLEEGTHDYLMEHPHKYAHMFQLQANKYQ